MSRRLVGNGAGQLIIPSTVGLVAVAALNINQNPTDPTLPAENEP